MKRLIIVAMDESIDEIVSMIDFNGVDCMYWIGEPDADQVTEYEEEHL